METQKFSHSQSLNNLVISPNAQYKLALRSHGQFKASNWSNLLSSVPWIKKKSVLQSSHAKRFGVSHMQDF